MGTVVVSHEARNTVLGIIQDFCRKAGLPRPATIVGNSNASVLQMLSLLEEVGEFCVTEALWPNCTRTVTLVAPGTEALGDIYTLCPDSYDGILKRTFWNRTRNEEIHGPVSPERVSNLKAYPASSRSFWYAEEGHFNAYPVIPAGESLELKYRSRHWLASPIHVTKASFSDDADAPVIPVELLRLGLLFYWRRAKELPYKVEEARFMDKLAAMSSRSDGSTILRMDGETSEVRPGIVVPNGNWSI